MAAKSSQASDELGPISEINVTPFVDVVLVLLVIFMVTAPMLVREQLAVKLPKASNGTQSSGTAPLSITVTRDGKILLNQLPTSDEELQSAVKKTIEKDPEAQAVLSADADAKHGDVVKAIDLIKQAGLNRFAIQIEKK